MNLIKSKQFEIYFSCSWGSSEIRKILQNFYFQVPHGLNKILNEFAFSLVKSVLNCISVLRPYWYCIQLFNENNPTHSLEDYLKNYIKRYSLKISSKKKIFENFSIFLFFSNDTKENNSDLKQDDIGSLSSESRDISDLLEDLSLTGNNGNNRTCICSDEIMSTHFNLINK